MTLEEIRREADRVMPSGTEHMTRAFILAAYEAGFKDGIAENCETTKTEYQRGYEAGKRDGREEQEKSRPGFGP